MQEHASTTTIRRSLAAPPERVFELWTTAAGIESWWAPEGFTTTVQEIDPRPDGPLRYTMTATGTDQVAFMEQVGLPLTTASTKRFTEVREPSRIAYVSLVDFVPDHDAYEHLTSVTLARTARGTDVVMEVAPMHDQEWTDRLVAGRTEELDNLDRLTSGD